MTNQRRQEVEDRLHGVARTADKPRSGWYREVMPDDVEPKVREASYKMMTFVKQNLELEDIQLRWFRWKRGTPPENLGDDPDLLWLNREPTGTQAIALPGPVPLIWVRANLCPNYAAMQVANWSRRLWQWREWERPQREIDRKTLRANQGKRTKDAEDYMIRVTRYLSEEIFGSH